MPDLIELAEQTIPDMTHSLDKISEDIKTLEHFFKKRVFVFVGYEGVEWKDKRIMYQGRPLLECSVPDKIEGFKKLPAFIEAAGKAVEKAVEELDAMFAGGE